MDSLDQARELDERGKILEAISEYERNSDSENFRLDDLINLSFLYFLVIDPGFSTANNLSGQYIDNCFSRCLELLDIAESKYGNNSEIDFWRKYYPHIFLGEKDFIDECVDFVNRDKNNFVPYFYLINAFDEKNIPMKENVYGKKLKMDLMKKTDI